MSRAMGSSCVFTCWGAASWHGGRVMLVFGARVAAGAGSCAGGGAPFGVAVVCGCTLVAVLAGGGAPVCGSGCGRWWVLSWREVCGVSWGGAGGVGCGVGGAWLRSCVGGLWCPVPPGGGGGCGRRRSPSKPTHRCRWILSFSSSVAGGHECHTLPKV